MVTDTRSISIEDRNTLLVVTTLIVAVTFQAALNPPGGVWQDDKYDLKENCTDVPWSTANKCTVIARAGTGVLHSRAKIRYDTFIFVNTMAFSAATIGAVQPQTPKTWAIILGALFAPYIFRLFADIKSRCK
ncbi:hypothetical protein OIU74_001160 [Salix koriyanagi]|uniref:PGG domain-containing protein n=1 Tax=Salix koriyanagi TaxID=2511006 RepID=A0A9Q1AMQ7_9ROSI|nr:hypothetical protein OIU74_001160 [Salix koriyanagi]